MSSDRTRLLPFRRALIALLALGLLALGGWALFRGGGPEGAPVAADPTTEVEALLADFDGAGFGPLPGPWRLSLPEDHGAHPEAQAETWAVYAHLRNEAGALRALSFVLTRYGLSALNDDEPAAEPWAVSALYSAQATLSGDGAVPDLAEERLSRGAGAAGADAEESEVFLDHWSLSYGQGNEGDEMTLDLTLGDLPVRLRLVPEKAPLAADDDDAATTRGFALPRVSVSGAIGAAEAQEPLSGSAWLDRLWGAVPVPGGPLAYDRLVLQLSDGTDLSLLRTRRHDGGGIATVDAVLSDPGGQAQALDDRALSLEPLEAWEADGDGASYPTAWRLTGAGLDLTARAITQDQRRAFSVPVWMGPVSVEGTRDGSPVTGVGTLTLTGYEEE